MASANLLKAVAAAADGYHTGEDVFVVASEDELDGLRVFLNEAEAHEFRAGQDGEWVVYGPYVTPPAGGNPKLVEKVVVTFNDGTEVEHTSQEVEAVFLTTEAVDRFVIPYYTRLRGVDFAAQLRADFLAGTRQLCCKGPWSFFIQGG